jgi:hypothetical protein
MVEWYRVYVLDKEGRVRSIQHIEAETIEAAVAAAQQPDPTAGVEVWLRQQCVAEFPSTADRASDRQVLARERT